MELLATLGGGIISALIIVFLITLAILWTVLPFYIVGLCRRVKNIEAYTGAIYQATKEDEQ